MLIDWNWLKVQLLKIKILKMATSLKVRGIGTSKHETDKYVLELLYFPAIGNKGQRMIVCIYCELHIVDNLRANIFIENNIIGVKGMMINIAKEKAYISDCKAIVPITAKHCGQFVKKVLYLTICVMIPLQLQIFVSTNSLSLPSDRDFYFEPTQQPKLFLFAHLMTHNTKGVLVQNKSNLPV